MRFKLLYPPSLVCITELLTQVQSKSSYHAYIASLVINIPDEHGFSNEVHH